MQMNCTNRQPDSPMRIAKTRNVRGVRDSCVIVWQQGKEVVDACRMFVWNRWDSDDLHLHDDHADQTLRTIKMMHGARSE